MAQESVSLRPIELDVLRRFASQAALQCGFGEDVSACYSAACASEGTLLHPVAWLREVANTMRRSATFPSVEPNLRHRVKFIQELANFARRPLKDLNALIGLHAAGAVPRRHEPPDLSKASREVAMERLSEPANYAMAVRSLGDDLSRILDDESALEELFGI